MNRDSLLLVEVPTYLLNPFDLIVADHCSHFTKVTLERMLQKSGFDVNLLSTEWVSKELTAVSHRTEAPATFPFPESSLTALRQVEESLNWLRSMVSEARALISRGSFGVFGTSIAATWLDSELGGGANFFVDEDLNRIGKKFMGRPVYDPRSVPRGSCVYIALPNSLAQEVQARLNAQGIGFECYMPSKPFGSL
jgi:hypothetical protein